ncbi:TonB-dependent receptor plug domain-containing protein [Thiomicrorhabdus cannonii]|uniref:TonB-dependent receptor plug domain-containing protein n=1 Tax=Thiomicrorhabdus cannonii TaxID=2748011 RepID=UPI0015B86CBB|nr:TonB-dependent receptor [Thiomicrorhabdus cannonii]
MLLLLGAGVYPLQAGGAETLDHLLNMPLDVLSSTQAEVESGSMLVKDPLHQPVAITVLTATDIRAFGYRTLSDIFNALPGLYTANDHIYTYAGARGLIGNGSFNSRILVTIDGHRFNDNIYHQVGLSGYEFPIDVALIDRVEFVPGPGGAANGNNAFLGVVNIITRSAASQHKAELAGAVGSGELFKGRATVFTDLAEGSLMLSATKVDSQGMARNYPNHGGRVAHSDAQIANQLFAKYENGPWLANFMFSDRTKQVPSMVEYTEFNNPNTWYEDRWILADLRYRLIDDADTQLTSRLHWGNYRFDGNYAYPSDVNYRGGAEGSWWGVELHGTWKMTPEHTLSAGIEFQNNYYQWLYTGEIGAVQPVIDSARQTASGAFWIEDHWHFHPQAEVILGLRHDRDMQAEHLNSPRFGLIYRPANGHTLRFNWAKAWITPSDYQIRYGSEDPTSGFQSPNWNLKPEYIDSYDLSWEIDSPDNGRWVASAFHYQTDDLIELMTPASSTQEIHLNSDSVTATGVQLTWHKSWMTGWRLGGSATWQTVTEEGSDFRVDAPEALYKMQLRAPRVAGILPALEWQYISERKQRTGDSTAPASLFNLTFTKAFSKSLQTQLSAFNLLDSSCCAPVSADFPMSAVPQDGRFVTLQLEWRY